MLGRLGGWPRNTAVAAADIATKLRRDSCLIWRLTAQRGRRSLRTNAFTADPRQAVGHPSGIDSMLAISRCQKTIDGRNVEDEGQNGIPQPRSKRRRNANGIWRFVR